MSLPIEVQFANPPPNANPVGLQALITLLNTLLSAEVTGTYLPYVIGPTTPTVEDQGKAWIKTDGAGRPLGTFVFYGGNWRRAATGLASELRMFEGNPATYFDGTGKGLINTDWDGWAQCNGQNGTPNWSDKFPVIGKLDDGSGYDEAASKWTTKVSGANLQLGGVKDITLTNANTYQPAKAATGTVGKNTADGNGPSASGGLYGSNVSGGTVDLVPADAGNTSPSAIPTLPPYRACCLCKWIGYA